jgi:hypothetical protein
MINFYYFILIIIKINNCHASMGAIIFRYILIAGLTFGTILL